MLLSTTLSSVVCQQQPFTFDKLSLQWPPSACTLAPKRKTCIDNIPQSHGIYSDLQDDPFECFEYALGLFNNRNLSNLQQDLGIEIGKVYSIDDIQEKLEAKFRVLPQVACTGGTQLWEIRFCYDRAGGGLPGGLRSCPNTLDADYNCDLNGLHLPPAPTPTPRMVLEKAI
ncbi:hypothetical protein V6N13_061750 [Hibiscus sabdariffa]|uniref:Uncharacterized protein n=1 Tax=Hibiscus sabdariffa TaxID=183260 RepID=A0ABR2BFF5_9ROSI